MAAKFLEVITRCYRRPNMLCENIASLQRQTDRDYQQVLLHDTVGRGVAWANEQLAHYTPEHEYVWVLDDDDMCVRRELIAELKAVAAEHTPDVIMVRMDHAERGILPDDGYWCNPPAIAHVGCSAYVVSRDTWMEHRDAWQNGGYSADHSFIADVFAAEPRVYWHDVIASKVQRISLGEPE